MKNKKFCPLPWIFQGLRNNGDIRVCCQANTSKSKGIYRKENGDAFNAKVDNLQESRNSELAKEIRKTMLNNEEHEACIRCDTEENSGVRSRRQYENELWENRFNIENAKEVTSADGTIDTDKTPIMYYDLRFGNLCNLKCRMCGPTDSNQWYNDWVKMWGKPHFQDSHGKVELVKQKNRWIAKHGDYNWFESDYFWKQLEQNIPNIQQIHTVGGEPLLIDKHYDLLQMCVDKGYAQNIVVEYNTNLTNIPQRAWNIWPHFKRIQIGASIDATYELNDYIRYPSKFDKIVENLYKLDEANGNFVVWIACTVQFYNAPYLPDFMKWVLTQKFKRVQNLIRKPILTTHPLHNPPFLNIKTIPKHAKKWIRTRYDSFYIWLEEYIVENNIEEEWANSYRKQSKKILEGYYDLMTKEDWEDTQLQEFWTYTNRLDEVRNEKFSDIASEYYEKLKE